MINKLEKEIFDYLGVKAGTRIEDELWDSKLDLGKEINFDDWISRLKIISKINKLGTLQKKNSKALNCFWVSWFL